MSALSSQNSHKLRPSNVRCDFIDEHMWSRNSDLWSGGFCSQYIAVPFILFGLVINQIQLRNG